MSEYRTVESRGESAFGVRGSEFIGHARPVRSVDAAEAFETEVREAFEDATHNVPAYRVRVGDGSPGGHMLREYADDDGEPTGSAGKPALNVLHQRDLENVAAVVTRYYGGTNLGVGGLARACSRAVTGAVDDAGVVEREPREEVVVIVAYDDSGTVREIPRARAFPSRPTTTNGCASRRSSPGDPPERSGTGSGARPAAGPTSSDND